MNWVLKKRSIWFHIIVTYFTAGIWAIIYFYCKNKQSQKKADLSQNNFSIIEDDDLYSKSPKRVFTLGFGGENFVFNKDCFTWKFYEGKTLDNYVIFDVETTGLEPRSERITEFSLLKYKDNKLVDEFTEMVNPHKTIPQIVVTKTGITDEMVSDKKDIDIYLDRIINFIGDNVVIGHNIEFDIKFLSYEIIRNDKDYKDVALRYIDTVELSRLLIKDVSNYKLDTLKRYLKIDIDSHRANNDCLIVNELYQYCKNEIDENMEIKRINIEKKMQNLNDDEKSFIYSLKEKLKAVNENLELDIDFKSSDIINFCVDGMQIGRVKLRGKKTTIQIITDSSVNWIENVTLEDAISLSEKWIRYLKKHI